MAGTGRAAVTGQGYDVVIIGGGMVGLSCGLELQRRGRTVAVVDPGDAERRASYGNAGVLSRGSILPVIGPGLWRNLLRYALGRDPGVRLRWRAFAAVAPWLRGALDVANEAAWRRSAAALNGLCAGAYDRHMALGEIAGTRPLIRREGWLRLYRGEAAFLAGALERDILADNGVRAEPLDAAAIRDLEPCLAPRFSHGLLFPETGAADSPGEVVRRYAEAFLRRGGVIVAGRAERIDRSEAGVHVGAAGRTLAGGHVVLCAGAWSGPLARALGCRVPLAAERGYHVHHGLAPGASLGRPINDTGGGYVVSPMDGGVRILSGVELARPDDPPDHGQIEHAAADAARILPIGGRRGGVWLGSRPSTPDGLPVIGPVPGDRRVILAFGHGHIGFSTGPITGEIVARLICGEPQSLPVGAFRPDRFGWRQPA